MSNKHGQKVQTQYTSVNNNISLTFTIKNGAKAAGAESLQTINSIQAKKIQDTKTNGFTDLLHQNIKLEIYTSNQVKITISVIGQEQLYTVESYVDGDATSSDIETFAEFIDIDGNSIIFQIPILLSTTDSITFFEAANPQNIGKIGVRGDIVTLQVDYNNTQYNLIRYAFARGKNLALDETTNLYYTKLLKSNIGNGTTADFYSLTEQT